MVAEIVAGYLTGSMALLADGWHMATHVVALSIAGIAYLLARRWATDERFAFGTWKIEVLGGGHEAHGDADEHAHGHEPGHGHEHHRHDLNLRSAYVHVLADAFTSVLAIVALAAGLWLGWAWLDSVMGIVGAGVILWWSRGLLGDSARVLLDREMDAPLVREIRKAIEVDDDAEIADLHVWRVGRACHAAVLTVVAHAPLTPAAYRARLGGIATLMHVSVEVNQCPHRDCP
jgi:Co/Zn/Cd efflux system component